MAVLDSRRSASWTFFVTKGGRRLQHYPLEAITWTQGGRKWNRAGVGVEHEGKEGEPLTDVQLQASVELFVLVREICPGLQGPVSFGEGRPLMEHRMVSATACPSDRIPWTEYVAQAKESINKLSQPAVVVPTLLPQTKAEKAQEFEQQLKKVLEKWIRER